MNIDPDYGRRYANVVGFINITKGALAKLHRCIEERRLIALPTADNVEDIRLFGFSNDQLNVLKTYPTLDPDQPPTPVTDEERSDILLQNLNSAQNRINRMENISTDDYYHILVVGETDSGKAAVINGLIRRDIIPSGGRHPTLAPVEILDAQDINGREEIHLCRKDMDYDYRNSDTFARGDIRNLSNIISNWQGKEYHVRYDTIRVYVDHRRARGSFFSNNRRKVHIIDSVDLNTAIDATRFLLENREINALMLIIDAREGLTESNENIMRSCCEEKKQIFVVITHLDCVCDCEDECDGSCSNIRKQKITYAIREISPETFASADRLIHGVNPTLVPLQNNNPGYATRQIPSEWARMEECLREFICEQSHFRSLSSIEDYLKKLMFDVLLFAQLNEAVAASKMEEKKRRILQLEDNIGRLEDEYVETCKVARIKVDETKSEVFVYILNVMNELKDNPEKFVSRELMNRIDPKSSEADLQRLLQERWREIEDEINQKVIEYIQNCANDINQLVKDLPKDSTQRDFATIRLMLQATYLNASDTEMPKKSLKSIVQDMTSRVLTGFEKNSVQTWTQIMYQTFIEINQNMRKDPELTAADDNEQENRQTPFDNIFVHSSAQQLGALTVKNGNAVIAMRFARAAIIHAANAVGVPVEVISIAADIVSKVAKELWKYFKRQLWSLSIDRMHKKAKEIVKEKLSEESFEAHATRAIELVEERLRPLLDGEIGNCYAAAMVEQMNQLLEYCEELERLDNEKEFFQQLNEEAIQVYTA